MGHFNEGAVLKQNHLTALTYMRLAQVTDRPCQRSLLGFGDLGQTVNYAWISATSTQNWWLFG